MKVAIVVQRYGADISGGAELHARYIAERLALHADVRVLTTCATDYVTWRNDFAAGVERVHDIPVERFPVARERDVFDFARRSRRVFDQWHSLHDELAWLESEGPASPELIARVRQAGEAVDFVLFFSIRYYHAFHGARAVPDRAVLVPTAEREPSLGLACFRPIFRGVRAVMYNSFEERALIHAAAGNQHVPGMVVGVGSDIPSQADAARARARFGLEHPYVIYVGRIDANKGCAELFDFFAVHAQVSRRPVDLVLIGTPVMRIPAHPRIRHLGYVSDQEKFDAIAGAEALIMPSYYESLSMVVLEAWALGRPVIVNAHCDVLLGQCIRSNAGLYYENAAEFAATLDRVLQDASLAAALGRNGRDYFMRHYSWPVIERKYLDMFERLASEPRAAAMEPLPGWLDRRRRTLEPAKDVLSRLPSGAALNRPPVTIREAHA
jgi:glycosyltransferase involved in cell wall biosynthesis